MFRAPAATLPPNLSRPRKLRSAVVNNRQILRRLNVTTPTDDVLTLHDFAQKLFSLYDDSQVNFLFR